MPSRTTLNGSQAIRDYLSHNPPDKPRVVRAALKAKGINVSSSLVSVIMRGLKTMGPVANPIGRPKLGGMNKSQVIRDYMKQHPAATPKKIHAAMKARGVLVSMTLVSALNDARRQGAAEPFAKSGGVSLSQAVREFLRQNPGANPKAIVDAMKSKGLTISLSLAYAIKYSKRGKKAAKGAGRSVGRPRAATSNGQLRAEDLLAAKAFVDRVGGTGAARTAIAILAQLGWTGNTKCP